jgi:hypothetical protein
MPAARPSRQTWRGTLLAAGRWGTSDATTCNRKHYTRVSQAARSGAPLLQRRLPAALAMLAALVLALLLLNGGLGLLFPTLAAWGLCLVGLARALTGRRRLVALLYALGAAPVTLAVVLVAFG